MFENKKVVCFGLGKNLKSYLSRIEQEVTIEYFSDNNSSLWGRHPLSDERLCIAPKEIAGLDNPLVIITIDNDLYARQVEELMDSLHIDHCRIQELLCQVEYHYNYDWLTNPKGITIHKFIDFNMHGTTTCNFHCDYCYVWRQLGFENNTVLSENHTAKDIRKALTKEILGGTCFINMCARGETFLSKEIIELAYELLDEGHFVSIVTNGTVSANIQRILDFPEEYQERFFFKLSFHYLELEKRNLFETFWSNVDKIKKSKCSYTLEITPYDGLVDRIPEIKHMFDEKANGAMPHISFARDSTKQDYDILSEYNLDKYAEIWGQFGSKMFELKNRHYGEKITQFCYAGQWSYLVNTYTGDVKACYRQPALTNIYADNYKGFPEKPVGHNCPMAYCYNNHAFMAWGSIPSIREYTYLDMRDRVDRDGNHWVKYPMSEAMSQKLNLWNYDYAEKWDDYNKLYMTSTSKRVILFNSPDYNNIGDHAIALAERFFFNTYFPEYEFIEVSCDQFQKEAQKIKKVIKDEDILVITGGGNIGSLWPRIHDDAMGVISLFPNNKILIFPQTIYFENSNFGEREKREFQKIIKQHGKVSVVVREERSYHLLQSLFDETVTIIMVPDMAFLLDYNREKDKRGLGICIRGDKESTLNIDALCEKLKNIDMDKVMLSTVVDKPVYLNDRRRAVVEILEQISDCEIVVTDRLHCMIFCILTNTPCVAFDNLSGKLYEVYRWVEDKANVVICHGIEELPICLDTALQQKDRYWNWKTDIYEAMDIFVQCVKMILGTGV